MASALCHIGCVVLTLLALVLFIGGQALGGVVFLVLAFLVSPFGIPAIVIRHSKHEYSVIAHLLPNSLCVQKGDRVSRGQVIAKCGNSGNTSEPHIHFQIQYGKIFEISAGLPILFTRIVVDGAKMPEGFITKGHYVENDSLV